MAEQSSVLGKRKQAIIIKPDGTFIEVSAYIKQQHNKSSNITREKVEKGVDITDHIETLSENVTLAGIVSNYDPSLKKLLEASKTVVKDDKTVDKANDAYTAFYDIWFYKMRVTVSTNYQTYEDMVIQNFNVDEDEDTGEILSFSVTFTNLRTVSDALTFGENLAAEKVTVDKDKTKKKKRAKGKSEIEQKVEKKLKEIKNMFSGDVESDWITKIIKFLTGAS